MLNPSQAVVGQLDGQVFSGTLFASGTNLFRGPPRVGDTDSVPDEALFVLLRGGAPVMHQLQANGKQQLDSTVVVVYRGENLNFEGGEDTARLVWLHLHNHELPEGYSECCVETSEPEFNGYDDTGRPQWTVNMRLKREE